MDAHLPHSRSWLDLLIAEAKGRMRRRRVLVGFAALAAVAAVVLTVQPWGGGRALGIAARDTAIAQIPGMTRVTAIPGGSAMSPCNGPIGPGGHYPHYCSVLKTRGGRYEAWILTSAYEQGSRWNVNVAFARAHPGPVIVHDDWTRFASPQQVALFMSIPDLSGSNCGHPVPAVNGGIACSGEAGIAQQGTPKQRVRQRERGGLGRSISFLWASGATVVSVNVEGVGLTLEEAQPIALLARPR